MYEYSEQENIEEGVYAFGDALLDACRYVLEQPWRSTGLHGSLIILFMESDPALLTGIIHEALNILSNQRTDDTPCPEVRIMGNIEEGLHLVSVPANTAGDPELN